MFPLIFLSAILLLCLVAWMTLTEFSYLPKHFTTQLYRRAAPQYEQKWRSPAYSTIENLALLNSLLAAAGNRRSARVLDLATGTGRIPKLLLSDSRFLGDILAIDSSKYMLSELTHTFEEHGGLKQRLTIECHDLQDWHFWQDSRFDLVTFFEASEIIPGLDKLVHQIAESVRPGGVLVMTRVTDWLAPFFPGRFQRRSTLLGLLEEAGFENISIRPWRNRYDLVEATMGAEVKKHNDNVPQQC